jgi:hypothetical protein
LIRIVNRLNTFIWFFKKLFHHLSKYWKQFLLYWWLDSPKINLFWWFCSPFKE